MLSFTPKKCLPPWGRVGSIIALPKGVVEFIANGWIERKIIMALLAVVGALILCSCILAALRSKRTGETSKVKTLRIR
jgi:hypothetical protein